MRRFLHVAWLVVLLAPPAGQAEGLSPKEMERGRKLYVAKCARCHKFYDPAKYTDAEWRSWMNKMSEKAKLKPDQKELLTRYLETFRGQGKTNAVPGGSP